MVVHASRADADDRKNPAEPPETVRPAPLAAVRNAPNALPARPTTLLGLRLPAFIAFGVGGLSTGGAVATKLAAMSSAQNSDCGASCSDARVARSKTLSATSTVLAGVAAAGIGTGIVLWLCSPADSERGGLAPALRFRVSTQKAVAGVVWKF